jgi:YegS/Rv2252/BmrU family lipid kinase
MDNTKKVHVIINPVSGTKSKKNIPNYFQSMDAERFSIRLLYTEYPGHATELAKEAVANNIDYVIAVGGDGTINEIAKALIGTNTTLGILPVGSGNGLARSLNIPMNKAKAINIISNGITKQIDYGIVNEHIFLCTCGVGFDALVSEKSKDMTKRGKLMYAKNMISTFYNFSPERYKIITPAQTFETDAFVVTCANAPQYGNDAYIAPNAKMDDGQMNVAILKPLSVFNIPKIAIQMFSKRIGNNRKKIEIMATEATILRENEGVMHLDGNAIYTGNEINIKIVHRGLNVLIPSAT